MYRFDKIKLVSWDLDDTLWKGIISEGSIHIPNEHRQLLSNLTDIGIVNSICSKNDWDVVLPVLEKEGLAEFFVFPSVNWNPKGGRIRQLIANMQLRPANVLFLDDNRSNLAEAKHACPDIMTGTPELISQLAEDAAKAPRTDLSHKRLKQYRILEEKCHIRDQFNSNEEFLYQSNVCVEIGRNCADHLERIHNLILRANQLNFTKIRSTMEDLQELMNDRSVTCGYVSVQDNFGDYGIVGFYALSETGLVHFVFSCRILGMGIEQYVYNLLNRPELTIAGEVISDLSSTVLPGWINQGIQTKQESPMQIKGLKKSQVLIKGPCDLFQIYPYIANTELFDTEFTYTTDTGLTIESTGHTTHIVEALRLSAKEKQRVLGEVPFTDAGMYCDKVYRHNYKVVVISILADCNLGIYRRKGTGERLAIMEYIHPLTDSSVWEGIISGKYPHAGFSFTEEILRDFSEKYEFVGRNTPEQIVENLQYIRAHLPEDCVLAVMLGGELYYEKNNFEAYMDRHLVHREVNKAIRTWAEGKENIHLMDVNQYLKDQSSFYDHFNHYIKPVYYALAAELVDLVNKVTGSQIRETSRSKMVLIRLKELLAPTYYKIREVFRR